MNQYTVRPVEPHEMDTWDEFVSSSPQGTLFHTSSWKRAVDKSYGDGKLLLIGCFGPQHLHGGCVALDRLKFGHRTAVTPLLTPYSGYLLEAVAGDKISDQVTRENEVMGSLAVWLQQEFRFQNLVNSPGLQDIRPLQSVGYQVIPRFTYELNLRLHPDELWLKFDGHVRRQIKKAEKHNFEINATLSSREGYELFVSTFKRRGQKCPVPFPFFEELAQGESLADSRDIFAAYNNGTLVSFIIFLRHEDVLYYAVASTCSEMLPTGVSSFLIWEAIRHFSGKNLTVLDFAGANVPSIARFKEGFNPQLRQHYQCEHSRGEHIRLGRKIVRILRRS